MSAVAVTPTLFIGVPGDDPPFPFTFTANPLDAVDAIRAGDTVKVPDGDVALQTLQVLGVPYLDALDRVRHAEGGSYHTNPSIPTH